MSHSDPYSTTTPPPTPTPTRRRKRRNNININNNNIAAAATKKSSIASATKESDCTCGECGKQFLSCKALFGHMRCHPEREWRGMHAPPKFRPRPRSRLPGSMTWSPEDREVAACLVLLANNGHIHAESSNIVDDGYDDDDGNGIDLRLRL